MSSLQVLVMAPRWSWLCWTSITSLFWPGGFSTCLSPSPGTWPGRLATTHGTQVTNLLQKAPEVPLMFLECFRISTFCSSHPQKTVWNFRGETPQSAKQSTETPPLLSWSSGSEFFRAPNLLLAIHHCSENNNDALSLCFFPLSAGDERWGFPQALTTWALWTGTWPCACSSPGSCATSASGRGPNPRERWMRDPYLSVYSCFYQKASLRMASGIFFFSFLTCLFLFLLIYLNVTACVFVCIGGLLHCNLPLSDADCAVDQRTHPAWCWDRHPVLPLPRPGTTCRPTGN